MGERLLLVGDSAENGALDSDVYQVHINGQTLESANTMTNLPMREVLSYAAEQCATHAEGMRETFQHLGKSLTTKEQASGVEGALVVHQEYGERGYVFCVAPDHALSQPELLQRMAELGASGDFSTLGHIRYIAVRQFKERARVVAVWNDSAFEFGKMFPEGEDAPGVDFGSVPRPDGSLRTLSATVEGAPAGVNTYQVKGKAEEVMTSLDQKLLGGGWKPVLLAKGVPDVGKSYTLANSTDLVVTGSDGAGGNANITYMVSKAIRSVSR